MPKPPVPRGSERNVGWCVLAFPAILWASSAGIWGLVQGHGHICKQGRKRGPVGFLRIWVSRVQDSKKENDLHEKEEKLLK